MGYRAILSVVFVTLSWRFMGTSAQTNATNITTTPLQSQNTTVAALTVAINRTGCGSSKLCVAQPSVCDPSTGSPCYFISAAQQSGQLYNFELSGQSDGYVAAALSTSASLDGSYQVYICGNLNGTVVFYSGTISLSQTNLIADLTSLNVSDVKGSVSSGKIQCTFGATLPNTTPAAGYSLVVATGSFTNGQPGLPSLWIKTPVVDLSNPNAISAQSLYTAVTPPNVAINRTGCGSNKLCAAQPSTCDPSTGSQCYFISAAQQSGQLYNFELSGQSDGYIAVGLSTSDSLYGSYQAYVCANINGAVVFFSRTVSVSQSNLTVGLIPLNVSDVKGSVSSGKIQCTFGATLPDTTRAAGYSLAVATGSFTNGWPGLPTFWIKTPVVNLADPNAISAQSQNTAVTPLTVAINRTGCGSKKLCAAEPSACDPSTGNPCYFISAAQQSGQLYNFELSGQSDGYVAAALSTSTDPTGSYQAYICANNNGAVNFLTGTINNYIVNLTSLTVSDVKGSVSSGKIQCTFGATLPDTTRAAGFSLAVAIGSYTNGKPGQSSFKIRTPVVNLSDPNANVTNLIINTISSGAYLAAHQWSLMMLALLLTVTILVFTEQ